MSRHHLIVIGLVSLVCAGGPANAAQLAAGSAVVPPAETGARRASLPADGAGTSSVQGRSAPALDLSSAVVGQVDPSRATLMLNGQTVAWDPERLRVFSAAGEPVGVSALQRGMRVRFALEAPAAGTPGTQPRRVVLIYLERAP